MLTKAVPSPPQAIEDGRGSSVTKAKERRHKDQVVRRTIELQPSAIDRLNELKSFMEAGNDTEVFRRALKILEHLMHDTRNGERFFVGSTQTSAREVRFF